MSEFGDDMREWRERKKKMRRAMVECVHCAANEPNRDPPKIHPGEPCRRCGRRAEDAS